MVCFYSGVDSFEGSGTMLLAFPGLKKIQDNASVFGNILMTILSGTTELHPEINVIMSENGSDHVAIPGGSWFLRATFERMGPDLVLSGPDGEKLLVRDYFFSDIPPDLIDGSGSIRLSGRSVELLVGPQNPGVVAQVAELSPIEPIGVVDTLTGEVMVARLDGSKVRLKIGDPVFQGDVLETLVGAGVGVSFLDESTFSLGENGRMILDEMIYDASAQTGQSSLSILTGTFAFVSGAIAKTGVDSMVLNTPTAVIGIRGTAGGGKIDADGSTTAALVSESGGFVGEMVFSNSFGTQTINSPNQGVSIVPGQAPSAPVQLTSAQIAQTFGSALSTLPNARASIDNRSLEAIENNIPASSGDQGAQEDTSEAGEGAVQTDGERERPTVKELVAERVIEQQKGMELARAFSEKMVSAKADVEKFLKPDIQFGRQERVEAVSEARELADLRNFGPEAQPYLDAIQKIFVAAKRAGDAEDAAASAAASLSITVITKGTGSGVGLSMQQAQELSAIVTSGMKALGAAGAISASASTISKAALAAAAAVGSGATLDPGFLLNLEKTVDSLGISAEKVEKIVDASIVASKSAWEEAYAAAKTAKKEGTEASVILAAAKQNAIDKFQIDVDTNLNGTGADYRDLSTIVDDIASGITGVKVFVDGQKGLEKLYDAIGFAESAIGFAGDTASYAREALGATTPEVLIEKAELAFGAATKAQAVQESADDALNLLELSKGLHSSVATIFQSAVSVDASASAEAVEGMSGIVDAVAAIEAASDFTTRSDEDPTKSIAEYAVLQASGAVIDLAASVEDKKSETTAIASKLEGARGELVNFLVGKAEAKATLEAYIQAQEAAQIARSESDASVNLAQSNVISAQERLTEASAAEYATKEEKEASILLEQQRLLNSKAELAYSKEIFNLYNTASQNVSKKVSEWEEKLSIATSGSDDALLLIENLETTLGETLEEYLSLTAELAEAQKTEALAKGALDIGRAAAEANFDASLELEHETLVDALDDARTASLEAQRQSEVAQSHAVPGQSPNKYFAADARDAAEAAYIKAQAALLDATNAFAEIEILIGDTDENDDLSDPVDFASSSVSAVNARTALYEQAKSQLELVTAYQASAEQSYELAYAAWDLATYINPHFKADSPEAALAKLASEQIDASSQAKDLKGVENLSAIKENEAAIAEQASSLAAVNALETATNVANLANENSLKASAALNSMSSYVVEASALATAARLAEKENRTSDTVVLAAKAAELAVLARAAADEVSGLVTAMSSQIEMASAMATGAGTKPAEQLELAASRHGEILTVFGSVEQAALKVENSAGLADAAMKLQQAEDNAEALALQAASEAASAAALAARQAKAQADKAAADRAEAQQTAAQKAEEFTEVAKSKSELAEYYENLATEAARDVKASLALDYASKAQAAASEAQAASEAAMKIASGMGTNALAFATKANGFSTLAQKSSGEAGAASELAQGYLEAAGKWVDGSASSERLAALKSSVVAAASAKAAATAATNANDTYNNALSSAVQPNVDLQSARAVVTAREAALQRVKVERSKADDGDDTSQSAIEKVWDNAVSQAQSALVKAKTSLSTAEKLADAADASVVLAKNALDAATASSINASQVAGQAEATSSFAIAYEIGAQSLAQAQADQALQSLIDVMSGDEGLLEKLDEFSDIAKTAAAEAESAVDIDASSVDLTAATAEAVNAENAYASAISEIYKLAVAQSLDLLPDDDDEIVDDLSAAEISISDIATALLSKANTAKRSDDLGTTSALSLSSTLKAAIANSEESQQAQYNAFEASIESLKQYAKSIDSNMSLAQSQRDLASSYEEDRAAAELLRVTVAKQQLASLAEDATAGYLKADAINKDLASLSSKALQDKNSTEAIETSYGGAFQALNAATELVSSAIEKLSSAKIYEAQAKTALEASQSAYDDALLSQLETTDSATFSSLGQANTRAEAAYLKASSSLAEAEERVLSAQDALGSSFNAVYGTPHQEVITLSQFLTAGDTLELIISSSASGLAPGKTAQVSYQVMEGDSLSDVKAALVNEANSNPESASLVEAAISSSGVITFTGVSGGTSLKINPSDTSLLTTNTIIKAESGVADLVAMLAKSDAGFVSSDVYSFISNLLPTHLVNPEVENDPALILKGQVQNIISDVMGNSDATLSEVRSAITEVSDLINQIDRIIEVASTNKKSAESYTAENLITIDSDARLSEMRPAAQQAMEVAETALTQVSAAVISDDTANYSSLTIHEAAISLFGAEVGKLSTLASRQLAAVESITMGVQQVDLVDLSASILSAGSFSMSVSRDALGALANIDYAFSCSISEGLSLSATRDEIVEALNNDQSIKNVIVAVAGNNASEILITSVEPGVKFDIEINSSDMGASETLTQSEAGLDDLLSLSGDVRKTAELSLTVAETQAEVSIAAGLVNDEEAVAIAQAATSLAVDEAKQAKTLAQDTASSASDFVNDLQLRLEQLRDAYSKAVDDDNDAGDSALDAVRSAFQKYFIDDDEGLNNLLESVEQSVPGASLVASGALDSAQELYQQALADYEGIQQDAGVTAQIAVSAAVQAELASASVELQNEIRVEAYKSDIVSSSGMITSAVKGIEALLSSVEAQEASVLDSASVALTYLSRAMTVALDEMSAEGAFSDVPPNVKASVESLVSGLVAPLSSNVAAERVSFALNEFEELTNAAQAEVVIELLGAPEVGRIYGVAIGNGVSEKSFAVQVSAEGYQVLIDGSDVGSVDVEGEITVEKIRDALIDAIKADAFATSTVSVEASYPVGEIKVIGVDANSDLSVTSLDDETAGIASVGVKSIIHGMDASLSEIKLVIAAIDEAKQTISAAYETAQLELGEIDLLGLSAMGVDELSELQGLADGASTSSSALQQSLTNLEPYLQVVLAQGSTAGQALEQSKAISTEFRAYIANEKQQLELERLQALADAAPKSIADAVSVAEDTAVEINVLANDKRADGDPLLGASIAVGSAAHGSVTALSQVEIISFSDAPLLAGSIFQAEISGHSLTIQADPSKTWAEHISGTISSNADLSELIVTVAEGDNIWIVAANGGTPFSLSDARVTYDENSLELSVTEYRPNGVVSYVPEQDYAGDDTFSYSVNNNMTPPSFSHANVSVEIVPVNDAPEASADFGTSSSEQATVIIDVLENDLDVDVGDVLSVSSINGQAVTIGDTVSLASGATVTIQSDGNFSYDPGENFAYLKLGETYEDTLAYVASDGEALSNSTSVTVTISGENSAPCCLNGKAKRVWSNREYLD